MDEHTNSLILHATKDDILQLMPLIEALDRPTRQVLIEGPYCGGYQGNRHGVGHTVGAACLRMETGVISIPAERAQEFLGKPWVISTPTTGLAANFPATLGTDGQGISARSPDVDHGAEAYLRLSCRLWNKRKSCTFCLARRLQPWKTTPPPLKAALMCLSRRSTRTGIFRLNFITPRYGSR